MGKNQWQEIASVTPTIGRRDDSCRIFKGCGRSWTAPCSGSLSAPTASKPGESGKQPRAPYNSVSCMKNPAKSGILRMWAINRQPTRRGFVRDPLDSKSPRTPFRCFRSVSSLISCRNSQLNYLHPFECDLLSREIFVDCDTG